MAEIASWETEDQLSWVLRIASEASFLVTENGVVLSAQGLAGELTNRANELGLPLESVALLDDQTVRLTFTQPTPVTWMETLTFRVRE